MKIHVITPSGEIFRGAVGAVSLPGIDGEFGVLSGHSDLFSLLKPGVIEIKMGAHQILVAINWGFTHVQTTGEHTQIDVLIDDAVLLDDTTGGMAANIAAAKNLLQKASHDKIAMSSVISRFDKNHV